MRHRHLNPYYKRLLIYIAFIFVIAVIIYSIMSNNDKQKSKFNVSTSQTKIENVEKIRPKLRRTIYGLETSGKKILNYRQACSMESAARMNPDMDVVLLMSFDDSTFRNRLTETLLSYENFKIKMLNLTEIFRGTAAENWYEKRMVANSLFPVEHLADAARYALIYKKGGIYMDLDAYILRSLSNLTNFISLTFDSVQVKLLLENHLFGFGEPGHPVLEMALSRLESSYESTEYFSIGPKYLWQMAEIYCLGIEIPDESVESYITEISNSNCEVKVHLVNNSVWNTVLVLIPQYYVPPNYIQSLGTNFHARNKNSKKAPLNKFLKSPFEKIMDYCCPKIISLIDQFELF